MTGYGWGEAAENGWKIAVELSSVNRRQSEITVNLPREFEVLEAQIRDEINQRVARGRVTVQVALQAGETQADRQVRLNVPLARAYARRLRELARELKLSGDVTLEAIMRAPGVVESEERLADAETFWPAVRQALERALEMLLAMRAREGAHLQQQLTRHIARLRRSVARVRRQAPKVQQRYRQHLLQRVRNAGVETRVLEEERILKEVVFFADRSDITEELARLESHFQQFDVGVRSGEPVGRTLDFLAQEMNREVNTIGAKANDAAISREVVVLKTELEKFREQAMNVE